MPHFAQVGGLVQPCGKSCNKYKSSEEGRVNFLTWLIFQPHLSPTSISFLRQRPNRQRFVVISVMARLGITGGGNVIITAGPLLTLLHTVMLDTVSLTHGNVIITEPLLTLLHTENPFCSRNMAGLLFSTALWFHISLQYFCKAEVGRVVEWCLEEV